MKSRIVITLSFVFMFFARGSVATPSETVLHEVNAPMTISVGNNRLYVSERTIIHVYSLPDIHFIKSFGSKGVGPGEFRYITDVTETPSGIKVCEYGKICFSDLNFKLIRETRTASLCSYFASIGEGFIGTTDIAVNKERFTTINFFDSTLKTGKEIFRFKSPVQPGKDMNIIPEYPGYDTFNDTVFLNGMDGRIWVFDRNGNILRKININTSRVKITDTFKKEYLETLKNDRKKRNFYSVFKDKITFPDYFPTIYFFLVTGNKIYVITYLQNSKGYECQVLNLEGKILKKAYLPIQFKKIRDSYPYTIKENKFYQLVEDVENENFVLHISDI